MPETDPDMTAERARYDVLLSTTQAAVKAYDDAVDAFMQYLRDHGTRAAVKPWEICGNLDSFHLDEDTDEGWYRVQCQFPKGHWDELGIKYHYDNGNEWSSGCPPEKATYPFREDSDG